MLLSDTLLVHTSVYQWRPENGHALYSVASC